MRTQKALARILLISSFISLPLYADPLGGDPALVDQNSIVLGGSSSGDDAMFGASGSSSAVQADIKSGFDAFNAKHQQQWKADFASGKVKVLRSTVSPSYGTNPKSASKAFLRDAHAVFGLKTDLSDLRVQKINTTTGKNHVRFQQTVGGVPVVGAQVIVHSNPNGQVTMAQSNYVINPNIVNKEVVTEVAAKTTAENDLATALNTPAISGIPKAEKQLVQKQGGYIYIWEVSISANFAHWVYQIDAETGAILHKANTTNSAAGSGTGKGNVYADNTAWLLGNFRPASLNNLFTANEGYIKGYLDGGHFNVIDNNGNDPYSATLSFIYNPTNPLEKDSFDATQAYYQLNKAWAWWFKFLNKYNHVKGASLPDAHFYDDSFPTFVNVTGMCNAFYSSDIDGNQNPGFAFGNDSECAPGSEDLTNDMDVIYHEFAHNMMDRMGFLAQFDDGVVNGYARSMGEGNADFYAYLVTPSDPFMGEVAFAWTASGYLRDLDNTRMYPRDVDEPLSGVSEEHYTGEIWSGYLYDLNRVLKNSAKGYVFQSSYYFLPDGGTQATSADFYDAIYAQSLAEQDLTGQSKNTAAAWGSMVSRGLSAGLRAPYANGTDYMGTGAAGVDDPAYLGFAFPIVKSVQTTGNLLLSGDVHEYVIGALVPGLNLTVNVIPTTNGLLNPTVSLYNIAGTLMNSIAVAGTGKATLTYAALPKDTYVITVTGNATANARGYYSINIATK